MADRTLEGAAAVITMSRMDTSRWSRAGTSRSVLFRMLALLVSVAAGTLTQAQQPLDDSEYDWGARGLSEQSSEVASIGLRLHLPLHCTYVFKPQSERRLEVMAKDKSWISAVDVRLTENDDVTVADVADETIKDSNRKSTFAATPVRATLDIAGQKAERLEIRMRPAAGQADVRAMYTIFKPLPKTFVVYKVWTRAEDWQSVFTLHKSVVESFRFSDPNEMAEVRLSEIARTIEAFARLKPEDYRNMLEPLRWYRVYLPVEGGQQEVAYYVVRELIGMKGMTNAGARPEALRGSEREEGILIELRSRYLLKDDGSDYVDVESTAWMAFDRKSERWSIRTGRYQAASPGAAHTLVTRSTTTGDRDGDRIQIIVDMPPAEPQTIVLRKPKDAYVCQAGKKKPTACTSMNRSCRNSCTVRRRSTSAASRWSRDRSGTRMRSRTR